MRIVRVRVEGRRPFDVRLGGKLSALLTWLARMPLFTPPLPGRFTVYVRPGFVPVVKGIAHESEHVEQIAELGRVRFAIAYVWEQLTRGYERNRFEVGARDYARANAHLFTDWDASCSA